MNDRNDVLNVMTMDDLDRMDAEAAEKPSDDTQQENDRRLGLTQNRAARSAPPIDRADTLNITTMEDIERMDG